MTKKTSRGPLKLYQVHTRIGIPPVLIAAKKPEAAAAIMVRSSRRIRAAAVVLIEVTDDFRAVSPLMKTHVDTLIAGGVEGVVSYDDEDGWTYDALRK